MPVIAAIRMLRGKNREFGTRVCPTQQKVRQMKTSPGSVQAGLCNTVVVCAETFERRRNKGIIKERGIKRRLSE